MSNGRITPAQAISQAMDSYYADIGQTDTSTRTALDAEVTAGRLVRYKGFWNTGNDIFGLGPVKTCWRATPPGDS